MKVYLIITKEDVIYAAGETKKDAINDFNNRWDGQEGFEKLMEDNFDSYGNLYDNEERITTDWRLIKAEVKIDNIDLIEAETNFEII